MPRSRGGRLAIKGTVDVVVDRPIQEVWEFVSDFKNMEGWVDGVSDLKPPEGELGIGSTFASKYTYGNRTHDITYEVTAFDPPLHIAMKSTSGPFPFEGTLTLEKWGDGTKVTNTIEAGSDQLVHHGDVRCAEAVDRYDDEETAPQGASATEGDCRRLVVPSLSP